MSSTPLEVKVIYDASSGGRKRAGKTVVRTGVGHGKWLTVGLINLVLACALYYGAWWRVDRDIFYPKLLMSSGIPGLERLADQMGDKMNASVDIGSPIRTEPPNMAIDARTIMLWSAVYGWLTLATIAYSSLALSAGSLVGRFFGGAVRRGGMILAVGALVGLALAAYIAWDKYEMAYKVSHLRWYMGGVGAALLLVGVGIAGHVRGLAKTASVTLLLSAVGSVVGMYLFGRIDALSPEQTTMASIGLVFVIHSLWAWLLWPVASRLPK